MSTNMTYFIAVYKSTKRLSMGSLVTSKSSPNLSTFAEAVEASHKFITTFASYDLAKTEFYINQIDVEDDLEVVKKTYYFK